MKIMDVARQSENQDSTMTPAARVNFNYTLEWYYGGFQTRKAWNMLMTDPNSNVQIAQAHQSFVLQNLPYLGQGQMYLSRWHVDIGAATHLPNWMIVFMAVLDDVDESESDSEDDD